MANHSLFVGRGHFQTGFAGTMVRMIRLSKITKQYDGRTVVHEVDLEFQQGKTYALIGPSGCGKSTLLRMLIGLIKPDGGSLFLDGRPFAENDIKTIRAEFGYVIQTGGLFPHLSAYQNAALPAVYRKWSKQEIEQRIRELRELVQLPPETLDRYPVQLSGGQRQRVSLMRALMLDPHVLLMDEPLGALDPMIRSQLQTQLRTIFQSLGKTVVMVTHDLNEAAFFADQIVLMQGGRIIQQDSVDDLLNRPANQFVTEFIAAQQSHLAAASGGTP
jgi:osmoprotectant transport system ATP-binding protein